MNPLVLAQKPIQKPLATPLSAKNAPQKPPVKNDNIAAHDVKKLDEKPIDKQTNVNKDNVEFIDFLTNIEPEVKAQNLDVNVPVEETLALGDGVNNGGNLGLNFLPLSGETELGTVKVDERLLTSVANFEQNNADVNTDVKASIIPEALVVANRNAEVSADNKLTVKPVVAEGVLTAQPAPKAGTDTKDAAIVLPVQSLTPQAKGQAEAAPINAEVARDVVSDVIDKLKILSPEILRKSNILPNALGKINSQLKNLVADINNNGLSEESKDIVIKLQNIAQQATDAKSVLNGFAGAVQKLTPENIEAIAKLFTSKDVEVKNAEVKVAEVKVAEKPNQAQQAIKNDADLQKIVMPSKYAGRYDATNGNAQGNINADGDEAKSQTRSAAVYDSAKSALPTNQPAAAAPSVWDKVVEKSPMDFLNQIQTANAAQTTLTDGQDNNIILKLATQNGRLPQNLPLNSLAFQISKQFNKGGNEFQIRLDPAELGKINVNLSFKKGGNLKAHMVVERSDVFELLQRDARALERALSEAGFEGENIELEFSLGENANDGKSFNDEFSEQADKNNGSKEKDDEEMVEMTAQYIPLHVRSTGVDRKI